MNFYAIIMAAGSGTRMGGSTPKQFLMLDGKPVLRHTIERFIKAFPDGHIVTVLPKGFIRYWNEYCLESGFHCPQHVVEGGITRYHSVRNALERVPDGAIVAIHDAVRPLVSPDFLRELVSKMGTERAVVPVVSMVDTLKVLRRDAEGRLSLSKGECADRNVVYGAQTPQVFRAEDIREAYRQAYDMNFTDDASVAQRNDLPLTFVEGRRYNIKITTPQDLEVVELLLKSQSFTQT